MPHKIEKGKLEKKRKKSTLKRMKNTLQDILKKQFWLDDFRDGQQEIIESIIAWNNTLVYMPTGGGKSLTYQLPWVVLDWVAIIISPLISLMKDQVDKLNSLWIRAELINSTLSSLEKREILHELSLGEKNTIKFLYIAPERLWSRDFLSALQNIKISLLAIDEAHCISQWGHDFRPSYMKIKGFIEDLQSTENPFPIVGLTATATKKVRRDIIERLGLETYNSFISGFDRKNIILIVRELSTKDEKQAKTLEIINKTPGAGIVYCSSRKHVVELSDFLISRWIKTWIYKWDLSPEIREEQQNKFMNDEYKVMVATNAFGMGIDKKDIRFVIHYNLPGSIENYYQEVWRAGRDGKKSFWVVLASYGDTKIQEFFIENTYPSKKEVLDLYHHLYKGFKIGEGKNTSIAKTYFTLASESGIENDMKVASIVKILEKYWILERGMQEGGEEDFRGRGMTLIQEKRQDSHLMIDWTRQQTLKTEAYYKLEEIKKLLFYPSCRKRYILEYFWDEEDLAKLPDNCWLCDYCLEAKNYNSEDVKKFLPVSAYSLVLETVKKYNEKFGQTLLVGILTGSSEKRITEWNLDLYEHYNALWEYSKKTVAAMFDVLKQEDFLFVTDGQFPCIGITQVWGMAIRKNTYLTARIEDLNGFVMRKTPSKTSSWSQTEKTPNKRKTWETYEETLKLYKNSIPLRDIAKQRELSLQTIESHIISLYKSDKISLLEILKMINLSTAKLVKEASIWVTEWLKDVKTKLEEAWHKKISYFEIKLTLAMLEKWDL